MSDKIRHALSDAVKTLGDIMLEMQRREMLARPNVTAKAREVLGARLLTDEQVADRAAKAFEAGALVLAELGHPGASVFRCNPSDVDPK